MHSANIETSSRLQSVLNVLRDGLPHSTRELIHASGMCAINSIISELRDNGIGVKCEREGRIYRYRLERA